MWMERNTKITLPFLLPRLVPMICKGHEVIFCEVLVGYCRQEYKYTVLQSWESKNITEVIITTLIIWPLWMLWLRKLLEKRMRTRKTRIKGLLFVSGDMMSTIARWFLWADVTGNYVSLERTPCRSCLTEMNASWTLGIEYFNFECYSGSEVMHWCEVYGRNAIISD